MSDGSSVARWCETPEQLDRVLWETVSQSDALVLDSHKVSTQPLIEETVRTFVTQHLNKGYVLVKTSTAGNRSPEHEISTSLLAAVLEVVAEVASGPRVFLGDGPADDIPYELECRRFAWDTLAKELDVAISDLNRGPSLEIAPSWPASRLVLEADVVVNLTKAKTHRRFGVSLAEKSLLGCLSGEQLRYPKLAGRHSQAVWLLDRIKDSLPPMLSVIDGVQGIQGEGPLNGYPTRSHFVVVGSGSFAPDVRAVVEMGFDPVLVPSFHRPYLHSSIERASSTWMDWRVTNVDFLPSVSCSWLRRSLRRQQRRQEKYTMLMEGAKPCWPTAT
jgi:uncharacterized protein (DUF362 family)